MAIPLQMEFSETVGRCNKSVHEGENLIAQMKE
jgi:hypothetical protein